MIEHHDIGKPVISCYNGFEARKSHPGIQIFRYYLS
jgi:hypothetical protein